MQTGLEQIRAQRLADRRVLHRRAAWVVLAILALFFAMCCMRTTEVGFVTPVQAAKNLYTMLRLFLAERLHWSAYANRAEIIRAHSYYFETVGMFKSTILVMVMGAVLAMAGGVFQCVFRNPIATPSMLGVSSSIRLVNLILVALYSSSIYQMVRMRYILGYVVALGSLLLIYFIARLMGGKKSSVTDMLLVGTVAMRVVQNLVSVYQYYYLSEEDYLVLEELNTYGSTTYQTDALLLMYALLIPHVCRYWFGSDFRNVLLGSAGLGAIMMMLCKLIIYALSFNYYLSLISVGTIINVVTTPLLILVLLQQKRGWT